MTHRTRVTTKPGHICIPTENRIWALCPEWQLSSFLNLPWNGDKLQKPTCVCADQTCGVGAHRTLCRTTEMVSKGGLNYSVQDTLLVLHWHIRTFHTAQPQQISCFCQLMTSFPKYWQRISQSMISRARFQMQAGYPCCPHGLQQTLWQSWSQQLETSRHHILVFPSTHTRACCSLITFGQSLLQKGSVKAVQAHLFCHNTWRP